MHRAFAVWLLAKPWRASISAVLLGVASILGFSLLAVPAGAVAVLATLARDARTGLQAVLAGAVSVGALLLGSGQPVAATIAWIALVFAIPFCLAAIAHRTGSLRLGFQIAVLGAALVVVLIYVAMDDPVGQWQAFTAEWMRTFADQLKQMGAAFDEQAARALFARTNWGTLVVEGLLTVLSSFFLGCWWQSLAQAPGAFGKEFQQLGLGKVLGALAVVVILASFALDKLNVAAPLLNALLWIAMAVLAIQGLAAAHRFRASGRMGRGWLVATYLLLIFAAPVMIALLAGWGVADNWRKVT